MEPSEPPDPPGDGHPLPPADEWHPAEGDIARLDRPILGDPAAIYVGEAVTVLNSPDEYGYVTVAAVVRVTAPAHISYLHKETS